MVKHILIAVFISASFSSFDSSAEPRGVSYSSTPPTIDGVANDSNWREANWQPMPYLMAGSKAEADDFSGRYQLQWRENALYLLLEVVDDVLVDQYADPLERYWDDDCVEIFIDEDASGGIHQYDHNAFAYHVALDKQVVDFDTNKQPALFNHHVTSAWRRYEDKTIWELEIQVFDDRYDSSLDINDAKNQPVKLNANKVMGFMLAYCDADGKGEREHFYGSNDIVPVNSDKNRGYIDASVFAPIKLNPAK